MIPLLIVYINIQYKTTIYINNNLLKHDQKFKFKLCHILNKLSKLS